MPLPPTARSSLPRVAVRRFGLLCLLLLLGGLLSATLARFAPGFGTDERELDPRLNSASIASIRRSRAEGQKLLPFYVRHIGGFLLGDLGTSELFNRPVRELIRDRAPQTLKLMFVGIASAWDSALLLAFACASGLRRLLDLSTSLLANLLLAVPSAVIALAFLDWRKPAALALGLVLFPHLFRYCRNMLSRIERMDHVIAAKARGLSPVRIFTRHILIVAAPELLALAGVSVNMAFGASIPVEVMADSPGIGQLAWQAALGRDLPLLVSLSMVICFVTLFATAASDLAGERLTRAPA